MTFKVKTRPPRRPRLESASTRRTVRSAAARHSARRAVAWVLPLWEVAELKSACGPDVRGVEKTFTKRDL